jgi:hypothetical protein
MGDTLLIVQVGLAQKDRQEFVQQLVAQLGCI